LFAQQNKVNVEPGFDEKGHDLMTNEKWKKILDERTKYIDSVKFEGTADRFRRNQPFWVHYIWTGGKHAGSMGQLRYFASSNLKHAFGVFKSDVKRYLKAGHEIAFSLSTGNNGYRQTLVTSEPMDQPSSQALIGWFLRVNFLPAPTTSDESKFFTMSFTNVDTKKTTTQNFPMSMGEKAVAAKWREALKA